MIRRDRFLPLPVLLLLLVSTTAQATTWVPIEVTCPVCGAVNQFEAPASFGTYVYQEPSKLQYVFWPSTTAKFLYTCRKCHLTAYMGDFASIPAEKVEPLRKMLEKQAAIEGNVVPYDEIPMTARLPIAEKVYSILDRDDRFWCEFRRIEGFHLEAAGAADEARRARLAALALAETLLEEDASTGKETLVIIAAMRRITGDLQGAERALERAKGLTYRSEELGEESSAGLNAYLDALIEDLRAAK